MTQPQFPPNCNAACRAKIILNGGRVRAEIENALHLSNYLELREDQAYQLIGILDEAEDKLIEWNNRRLTQTGYKRRTPKASLPKLEGENDV